MRFVIAALPLLFVACGGEEGASDVGSNCVTEWNCVNEVCECADGSACADADDCDASCEVCE